MIIAIREVDRIKIRKSLMGGSRILEERMMKFNISGEEVRFIIVARYFPFFISETIDRRGGVQKMDRIEIRSSYTLRRRSQKIEFNHFHKILNEIFESN